MARTEYRDMVQVCQEGTRKAELQELNLAKDVRITRRDVMSA